MHHQKSDTSVPKTHIPVPRESSTVPLCPQWTHAVNSWRSRRAHQRAPVTVGVAPSDPLNTDTCNADKNAVDRKDASTACAIQKSSRPKEGLRNVATSSPVPISRGTAFGAQMHCRQQTLSASDKVTSFVPLKASTVPWALRSEGSVNYLKNIDSRACTESDANSTLMSNTSSALSGIDQEVSLNPVDDVDQSAGRAPPSTSPTSNLTALSLCKKKIHRAAAAAAAAAAAVAVTRVSSNMSPPKSVIELFCIASFTSARSCEDHCICGDCTNAELPPDVPLSTIRSHYILDTSKYNIPEETESQVQFSGSIKPSRPTFATATEDCVVPSPVPRSKLAKIISRNNCETVSKSHPQSQYLPSNTKVSLKSLITRVLSARVPSSKVNLPKPASTPKKRTKSASQITGPETSYLSDSTQSNVSNQLQGDILREVDRPTNNGDRAPSHCTNLSSITVPFSEDSTVERPGFEEETGKKLATRPNTPPPFGSELMDSHASDRTIVGLRDHRSSPITLDRTTKSLMPLVAEPEAFRSTTPTSNHSVNCAYNSVPQTSAPKKNTSIDIGLCDTQPDRSLNDVSKSHISRLEFPPHSSHSHKSSSYLPFESNSVQLGVSNQDGSEKSAFICPPQLPDPEKTPCRTSSDSKNIALIVSPPEQSSEQKPYVFSDLVSFNNSELEKRTRGTTEPPSTNADKSFHACPVTTWTKNQIPWLKSDRPLPSTISSSPNPVVQLDQYRQNLDHRYSADCTGIRASDLIPSTYKCYSSVACNTDHEESFVSDSHHLQSSISISNGLRTLPTTTPNATDLEQPRNEYDSRSSSDALVPGLRGQPTPLSRQENYQVLPAQSFTERKGSVDPSATSLSFRQVNGEIQTEDEKEKLQLPPAALHKRRSVDFASNSITVASTRPRTSNDRSEKLAETPVIGLKYTRSVGLEFCVSVSQTSSPFFIGDKPTKETYRLPHASATGINIPESRDGAKAPNSGRSKLPSLNSNANIELETFVMERLESVNINPTGQGPNCSNVFSNQLQMLDYSRKSIHWPQPWPVCTDTQFQPNHPTWTGFKPPDSVSQRLLPTSLLYNQGTSLDARRPLSAPLTSNGCVLDIGRPPPFNHLQPFEFGVKPFPFPDNTFHCPGSFPFSTGCPTREAVNWPVFPVDVVNTPQPPQPLVTREQSRSMTALRSHFPDVVNWPQPASYSRIESPQSGTFLSQNCCYVDQRYPAQTPDSKQLPPTVRQIDESAKFPSHHDR